MEFIGYASAIFIGITLGLIGGGGSILTVPILVYLFKVNPELATSYSLFIVGTTALYGSYRHYVMGNLKLKSALYFALPSVLSLVLIRKLALPNIPHHLLQLGQFQLTKDILIMSLFAVLMMVASLSMIRTKQKVSVSKQTNFVQLALIGLMVGMVTGFLGAGGGFLIIPALIFFAKLPMKQAVGTSLFIIFINSCIGFIGDILNGVQLNYSLLFTLTGIALIGIFIGTVLSKKIEGAKLKPIFGWFILIMGVYILMKELFLK